MFGTHTTYGDAKQEMARAFKEFAGTTVILAIFRTADGQFLFSGGSLEAFARYCAEQGQMPNDQRAVLMFAQACNA